ncbi:MAG: sugar ABC transporter ATP-binding protein [Planctomycetota bacterium]
MDTEPKLLTMRGIVKRFPGVLALDHVQFDLARGEVVALAGENGAGKSTLMKILGGVHEADEGEIQINGEAVKIGGVSGSKKLGIALIHQELLLAPNLDIAGNIFLGEESTGWGPFKKLNRATMNAAAETLLARVGLKVKATTLVGNLTTGQMQMVEIAKALSRNARIIVMDEPTSSLTSGESEKLFEIIADLKRDGISVIYISHRMEEILRITDRVTVMRDGKYVGDLQTKTATHDSIISMMIGRELSTLFPKRASTLGEPILKITGLRVPGTTQTVSFEARRGEILGFAGLIGSGRTELMRTLFGVDQALGGSMWFDGSRYLPNRPADAIKRGLFLVPEDRKLHGLVLPMSIAQNISLPDIANYKPRWRLAREKEREVAQIQKDRLNIKASSIQQVAGTLSGGNQQKIVLGKWLAMNPKLLILDEPTRGIDVGAKAEIYRQIAELAAQGLTIIMVSSEMEEVIGMSDRIAVMHERRLAGILDKVDCQQKKIMALMTGKHAAETALAN